MAIKQNFTRIVGVVAVAVLAQASTVAPAAAQSTREDNCVCIVPAGTVGKVTSATGWVKLNGKTSSVDAVVGAPLSLGSVLRAGVAGNADAMVGETCDVHVASLEQMSISAIDDTRMCVRLTGKKAISIQPLAGAAAIGLLGGGLAIIGLGQENPVSAD